MFYQTVSNRIRMLSLITCTALLLAASAPFPANLQALAEAKAYFISCSTLPTLYAQLSCVRQQTSFAEAYLWAKSGETGAMVEVANYLRPGSATPLARDGIASCAWALAATEAGTPPRDGRSTAGQVDRFCSALSDTDRSAADERTHRLLRQIVNAPSHPPPDWSGSSCDLFRPDYAAKGQFAPPLCPSHPKLDSSVQPLTAD